MHLKRFPVGICVIKMHKILWSPGLRPDLTGQLLVLTSPYISGKRELTIGLKELQAKALIPTKLRGQCKLDEKLFSYWHEVVC